AVTRSARRYRCLSGSCRIYGRIDLRFCRQVECEDFFGDDARAVEGVVEPGIGSEGMMSGSGDDAIFEEIAGLQPEDADRLNADVLVGGSVDYSWIGIIGDGAGKNVRDSAAGVSDSNQRNFDRLETAVEIK